VATTAQQQDDPGDDMDGEEGMDDMREAVAHAIQEAEEHAATEEGRQQRMEADSIPDGLAAAGIQEQQAQQERTTATLITSR
jgi:hypothetical protein